MTDKILSWLNERIDFINRLSPVLTDQKQISDFILAEQNFNYCKKLYIALLSDQDNADLKKKFYIIACQLIFDALFELDKQEYKCFYVGGAAFPTREKETLPQNIIDNIADTRTMLWDVYSEIFKFFGGHIPRLYI